MTDHSKTSGEQISAPDRSGSAATPGATVGMKDAPATDLPGPGAATTPGSQPPVDSSLVGSGGLAAMARKPDAAEAPLRLGKPAVVGGDAGPSAVPKIPGAETTTASTSPSDLPQSPMPEPVKPSTATAKAPDPLPSRTQTPPERIVEVRRGGLGGMVLGGLIAAGLGAGAAYWAIPRLPAAWQPVPATDSAALNAAAIEAARAEIGQGRDELLAEARTAAENAARAAAEASLAAQGEGLLAEARTAGADAAAKLIAEAPATAQPDSTVQTTLAAQAQQLAALDEALQALRAAPPAGAGAGADLAPLEQRLAAQATRIEELAARPALDPAEAQRLQALAAEADAATQRIEAAAAEAGARLQQAEDRSAELSAAADAAARRARAAAAAASLGEAIQTGAPRDAALAELDAAGVEAPAALTAEIPTPEQLAAEYPAAARAAVRAALRAESASGEGSVIGNFLRAQTGARSVAPREGADADAVLSRAGDAVRLGRIDAALAELATLPEPARPAMAAWTARAQAYADAQTALGGLTRGTEADGGAAAPAAPAPDAPTDPAAAPAVSATPAAPSAPAN